MTIIEAINQVDDLVLNTYGEEQKIRWLSQLDGRIKTEIIDAHELKKEDSLALCFEGYDEKTPLDTELLVPAPYDNVYILWLLSQIHFTDGETGRYNNTSAMFAAEYASMANHYNRTHMPKGQKFRFF